MAAPMCSMEEPMETSETCEIEATVVTGFEQFARDEILEKLNVPATTDRGKVTFTIPVADTKKVLELSSIDNAYVIAGKYPGFVFADNVDAILDQLSAIVPQVDWSLGLRVWAQVFSFKHPISPNPAKPTAIHDGDDQNSENTQLSTNENPQTETNAAKGSENPNESSSRTESNLKETTDKNNRNFGDTSNETGSGDASNVRVSDEPDAKRVRQTSWNPLMPAFRVTCYRSGKHIFQSPQAAAHFGGAVNSYFGWNVDMKKFDIEVILVIEGTFVYVCLGLTKESLHKRNITKFGPTTLRPTIAYNILRFCRIRDFDVVCDPMCGGGSIPIEASINWPRAFHLCGDIFDQAPPRTRENMDTINDKRKEKNKSTVPLGVFRWDASRLPLRDESVDVFVTDMPFGKRSGSKLSNWHLYPKVLRDMARVCKRETGRACLLTQDRKCFTKSLMGLEGLWRKGPQLSINIGGLAAGVFLLYRTARKFMSEEELEDFRGQREERRKHWDEQRDGRGQHWHRQQREEQHREEQQDGGQQQRGDEQRQEQPTAPDQTVHSQQQDTS